MGFRRRVTEGPREDPAWHRSPDHTTAGGPREPNRDRQRMRGKLSQYACRRRAYQDQQAAGLMTLEELRLRLEELDEARKAAEAELTTLRRSQERTMELKRDRDAVSASLARRALRSLDTLSGEGRNRLYRTLRMEITPTPKGFDVTGVFCTLGPTPAGRRGSRERRGK